MRIPRRAVTNLKYSFGHTSVRTSTRSVARSGTCAACVKAKPASVPSVDAHETIASIGSHAWPQESHTRSYSATSPYDIRDDRTGRVLGAHPPGGPHVAGGHRPG